MPGAGFGPAVFAWFDGLERDNSKAYVDATRSVLEAEVRGGLAALLEDLAREFGGRPRLFRQHRDRRFARDAPPYKTRTYGVLEGAGVAGLYAELSARGLYAGSGYHRMARDQLERYRAAVLDDGATLAAALAGALEAGLELEGDALRTVPRGLPAGHPHADLLRRKAIILGRRLPGGDGIGADSARAFVAATWRAAAPALAWLDERVGAPRG